MLLSCQDYDYDSFVGASCVIEHFTDMLHATWTDIMVSDPY